MDLKIEALKHRDRDAWRAVYEKLVDGVYQHALWRLGGDREAAEDVTQEVFVRAIESIGTFRGDGSGLLQWLRGICRRVLARRARNVRPPAARPVSLDGEREDGKSGTVLDPVDPRPLADEQLVNEQERWLTGAALTALPPHWEHALRWKYCDGVRVTEIAQRLGISPKAAESLLSRARTAFRETYVRFSQGPGDRIHDVEEWHDGRTQKRS